MKLTSASAVLLCSLTCFAQNKGSAPAARWWSHMQVLASDKLEGRLTGSPGHRKAVEYAAQQLKKAGLKPAGTDGYFQPVSFVRQLIDESHSKLELLRGGTAEQLSFADDSYLVPVPDLASNLEAPLVFVGYGLTVPEKGIEDLKGLDLKGKVVVYLYGAPSFLPGPLSAHAQSIAERWRALKEAAAVGVVRVFDPDNMDIPWARLSTTRTKPNFSLADPLLIENSGLQVSVSVNPAKAEKWFEGSQHRFAEILALAKDNKPLPKFDLPARIRVTAKQISENVTSDNVVALIPGSDPKLKNEYLVVSAHIDHFGVGTPINGDSIYNGALDNASGCATLLETAASMAKAKQKPRRSVIFLLPTAEEQGTLLLGSEFFVRRPTVPINAIVANVNVDAILPLFPLKSLIVLGMDESDLGDDVRAVASRVELEILPDPYPKRVLFIRSDQYSFVRQGIPALWPREGFRLGTPEDAKIKQWLTERYHAPSDDLQQPMDRQSVEAFNRAFVSLVLQVANRETRATWNENSFFRRFAKRR